tara:strand:+ start:644 stop:925 length:282 start_codon:yes stop_codon:yes gene_type:complete
MNKPRDEDEMVDKFFEDLSTVKTHILEAMDKCVEQENVGVRAMLFSSLIICLHANHAMSHDLYGDEFEYETIVEMAKKFVTLNETASPSQNTH